VEFEMLAHCELGSVEMKMTLGEIYLQLVYSLNIGTIATTRSSSV